jgi:hypothetical protein
MQGVLQDFKAEALAATHAEFNQLALPLKTEMVRMRK